MRTRASWSGSRRRIIRAARLRALPSSAIGKAMAFAAGGGTYAAPAQRVGRFSGRPARAGSLGRYRALLQAGRDCRRIWPLCLPDYVVGAIREALPAFARQIAGFAMADAVMTGVETRTSSPIRITRGADFQSVNTAGLYPAGEGAGYAGGILSAAVDGIRVAEAVALSLATK